MVDKLQGVNDGPVVASLIGYVIFVCPCPSKGVITLAVSAEAQCGFCAQAWRIKKFHYDHGQDPVVEVVPTSIVVSSPLGLVPGGRA